MPLDAGSKAAPQPEIELTANARRVLQKRYLRKDAAGRVMETPAEMFRRVAGALAAAELQYDASSDVAAKEAEFYGVMSRLEFLPNSPTLLNASKKNGQLAACFALPVEDSVEGIFDAMKYTALIHKSGGGTGYSLSRLRPAGDMVDGVAGIAGGPVNFLSALSAASDVIRQGGVRRGCSIGLLSVHHPDILKFIVAKDDPLALTNFCISVAVTDDFMKALESGSDYDLINPRTGKLTGASTPSRFLRRLSPNPGRPGTPAWSLSTASTAAIPPPTSVPSRQSPAVPSRPFCPTNPATWVRSIWLKWSKQAAKRWLSTTINWPRR